MPLPMASTGEEILIRRVGGTQEVRQHLENLGFVPGTEIRLISKISGNVIVKVKESRVALDEKLAMKIMV